MGGTAVGGTSVGGTAVGGTLVGGTAVAGLDVFCGTEVAVAFTAVGDAVCIILVGAAVRVVVGVRPLVALPFCASEVGLMVNEPVGDGVISDGITFGRLPGSSTTPIRFDVSRNTGVAVSKTTGEAEISVTVGEKRVGAAVVESPAMAAGLIPCKTNKAALPIIRINSISSSGVRRRRS